MTKKKPALDKATKTRDDWIAQGYDAEAVDTAMEAKPALDTKVEIFKFWKTMTAIALCAQVGKLNSKTDHSSQFH